MKAKTIKKIITNKFYDFLKSIEDKEVKELVENGTIVTGGCITSMLLNEDVNDFDMYFKNFETAEAVTKYFVGKYIDNNPIGNLRMGDTHPESIDVIEDKGRIRIIVKSSGVASESRDKEKYQYFEGVTPRDGGVAQENFLDEVTGAIIEDPDLPNSESEVYIENLMTEFKKLEKSNNSKKKYRPIFLTSNAITLSDQIQLIIRFYGNAEEIHRNYDFVHCTNYWTSWDGELVLKPKALESILTKELIYTGSLYPLCSVLRIRKFIQRGWTINAGQILKMCLQISDLNLQDRETLQDQLIGVDVAYFCQLLNMMSAEDPAKINTAYIADLIDRIF